MPSDSSATNARRPARVGKYEILAHIATGGMATVYRARDTEIGREVALKVVTQTAKGNAIERIRREARHVARLSHENIVTLYEYGEADGNWYLALEYVEGIDLNEYINRKGRLDPEETRTILIQAARALGHASEQGVIHRDIKPSNFLLTRSNGDLVVKLTDLGLARQSREVEGRVTRDGSTVGTIDYIAPEQALDSASADVRSDIYSLGCTAYHMLTGKPPFPDGSLAERIYKHLRDDPLPVQERNPRVPAGLAAILQRMMAKKRENRYQTPAELLRDLEEGRPTSRGQGSGVRGQESGVRYREPGRRDASSSQRRARGNSATVAAARRSRLQLGPRQQGRSPVLIGTALALLVMGLVAGLVLLIRATSKRPTDDTPVTQVGPQLGEKEKKAGSEAPKKDGNEVTPNPDPGPAKPRWLYPGAETVEAAPLAAELERPWAADSPPPAGTALYRVRRIPVRASGSGPGPEAEFESLAAACVAARAQPLSIVEIHDNGPLYVPAVALKGHSLILRAGPGYRPLLVWDPSPPPGGTPPSRDVLLSMSQGSLTLENLDLVLARANLSGADLAALAHVSDGDFLARDCTFSVAGKQRGGVAVVRFEGGKCRLSRCLARGTNLMALDLRRPGADVLLDGCLVVGGEQPVLHVTARGEPPTTLRVARSTLVAGRSLVKVRLAAGTDVPALHWVGWDSLLARTGDAPASELLAVEGADTTALKWRSVNCLYAGWKTLLAGAESIAGSSHDVWLRRWQRLDGDRVDPAPWPVAAILDPAEINPREYRTAGTAAGYAATGGGATLGCNVESLPPARDNWLALTTERGGLLPLAMPDSGTAPEIPTTPAGLYHGGRLDPTRTDLGAYLREVQRSAQLGPRVVLHLAGSGEARSTPVKVSGSSLVLYFEPAEAGATPLVLAPPTPGRGTDPALIEVEKGDLEVIGGQIQFPNFRQARLPSYLLKVSGGDLRLQGCRLIGPLGQAPGNYRGLVHFEGSGEAPPRGCAVYETILVSGKAGVHVTGSGARLHLRHNVLVAGTDAVYFEPGAAARPRLDVQGLLEHNTVAARGALLGLADAAHLAVPAEPIFVQAKANVILAPFGDRHRAGLIRAEGMAFVRGLLSWQSEGNVYDKRLHYFVAAAVALPDRPQSYAVWAALGGPSGDRQAVLDLPLRQTFDLEPPPLCQDFLSLSWTRRPPVPGADLAKFNLPKRLPATPK